MTSTYKLTAVYGHFLNQYLTIPELKFISFQTWDNNMDFWSIQTMWKLISKQIKHLNWVVLCFHS